jgi:hypothetical protein
VVCLVPSTGLPCRTSRQEKNTDERPQQTSNTVGPHGDFRRSCRSGGHGSVSGLDKQTRRLPAVDGEAAERYIDVAWIARCRWRPQLPTRACTSSAAG